MLEGENRSNAILQNSQDNTPNLKQITLRTSTITPQLIFNIQCTIMGKVHNVSDSKQNCL